MTQTTQKFWPGLLIIGLAISLSNVGNAQVLLRDDFNDTGIVNPFVWRLPFEGEGTFVGRTQFRGNPATDLPLQGISVADGASTAQVAEIHLDTFSPIDPGNQFLGTDLLSRRNFARGGGLAFESRLRLDPTNAADLGGVLGGFFLFDVTRENDAGDLVRDEIDFELLGNQAVPGGNQDILTNVFSEDPFTGPDAAGDGAFVDVAGLDLTEFQTYRVEWTPDSVEWFVNGTSIRTVTTDIPDDPQELHFNIWAPDTDFAAAFNAALQPTADASLNQRFTTQIDYVEVERFNTDVSANLLDNAGLNTSDVTTLNAPGIPIINNQWFAFNNAFQVGIDEFGTDPNLPDADSETPTGLGLGLTFGPFNTNSDASGFFQQVAASEGEEFEASANLLTASGDSIVGTENFTQIALSFLDSAGNVLQTTIDGATVDENGRVVPLIDGRDPNQNTEDEFIEGVVSAIAPEDTAAVRVSLFFIQIVDPIDASDVNDDGVVDAADFVVIRDGGGGDQTFADFVANFGDTGATGPNGDDGAAFFDNVSLVRLTDSTTATVSSLAIPEPSSAVLLLLGVMSLSRSRRSS